ncbi:MAG: DinB family protein [Anaerolineales bacterium]
MKTSGEGEASAGTRTAIETLTQLLEVAFQGDSDQSLLASLRDLRGEDWTALPAGAGRSIADILEHVGWAKWMYEDYAFGPGTLRGDRPPMVQANGARARPRNELLAWLHEGHRRWTASVRALPDDAELGRVHPTNWGDRLPTRTLIRILIGHDFYHAGEINHLRALLQASDRWPYDS